MRSAAAVALAAAASLLYATPAHACSCVMPKPLTTAYREAKVAFVGDVTGRRDDVGDYDEYDVAVRQVLKGSVPATVVVKAMTGDGASCGATAGDGVFLYVGDGDLRISSCSYGVRLGDAVAFALTELHVPMSPSPAATSPPASPPATAPTEPAAERSWWVPAGAVALAAAAAFALVIRRRSARRARATP